MMNLNFEYLILLPINAKLLKNYLLFLESRFSSFLNNYNSYDWKRLKLSDMIKK